METDIDKPMLKGRELGEEGRKKMKRAILVLALVVGLSGCGYEGSCWNEDGSMKAVCPYSAKLTPLNTSTWPQPAVVYFGNIAQAPVVVSQPVQVGPLPY